MRFNSHSGLLPDPTPFPGWGTKALNMSQATRQWQEREGEGEEEEGAYTTDIIKKHILRERWGSLWGARCTGIL